MRVAPWSSSRFALQRHSSTPSAIRNLERIGGQAKSDLEYAFLEWPIPLKEKRTYEGRALIWPVPEFSGGRWHPNKEKIARIMLRPPVLADVERKYQNTIKFHDKVLDLAKQRRHSRR